MNLMAVSLLLISSLHPGRTNAIPVGVVQGPSTSEVKAAAFDLGHSYDVLRYRLYMDWYAALSNESLSYHGEMEITFVPGQTSLLDSINVDVNPSYLSVDSVLESGRRLMTDMSNGELNIVLAAPLSGTDTGRVAIFYHVINPGISGTIPQNGFYLYYAGQTDSATGTVVPETIGYTMSEPSDARAWMPCYDDPSDKALCDISVRVPDGFVAASNGTLTSEVDNGDGSTTFSWQEDYPVATYLMCVTAAKFSVVRRSFVNETGDTVPVMYYVYPTDSLAAETNTACNIDSVVAMLKFFSSIYGPYPFDKYGMTGIQPFRYGGMEHQTITTMNRSYEFDRRDVAHELAHQWWGDMVTLGTWKDIWLNEGFATYSEAMQLQHENQASFTNEMNFYASEYFAEDSAEARYAVYAPPVGYIFGLAEYYKGAWVLHMLRSLLGDSDFFGIMRRYRDDFQYGNAVTSDFVRVADTVSGLDLNWFFNEWIYKAGYPVYTSSYTQSGDTVVLTINQIQTNAPAFKMPVEVGVYSGGNMNTYTVWDSLQHQSFRIYFQGTASSVELDPFGKILARYPNQEMTSVGSKGSKPASYSLLQNYPNPFNGFTNIVYSLSSSALVTVDLFDVLGRKVETLVRGYEQPGMHRIVINAGRLASGVYLCRVTAAGKQLTTKLVLEK